MRAGRALRCLFCVVAIALALAMPVEAAPCAGFTDVDSTNPFCSNIEWLKNRGITIGCTSLTLYCPANVVTRESMSIFLQRLGNAMTPTLRAGYNTGSSLDLDALPVLCPTALHTPPASPQTAHGVGYVLGWTDAASSMDVSVTLVSRANVSAPWDPASPVPGSWSATGNGTRKGAVVLLPPQTLLPGVPIQWGLRVGRSAGSINNGDFVGWNCQLVIEIDNRVTTSSPFDEEE